MWTSSSKLVSNILIAAVAFLLAASAEARAQTRPFSVAGSGIVEFIPLTGGTARHNAFGVASFIGPYAGQGAVEVVDPTTGEFDSAVPFVFRGRNGTLAYDYGKVTPGVVMVIPVGDKVITVWDAIFTLRRASSRRVSDSTFRMIAISARFDPTEQPAPVPYVWFGSGTITFGR